VENRHSEDPGRQQLPLAAEDGKRIEYLQNLDLEMLEQFRFMETRMGFSGVNWYTGWFDG
jgi:hypothetical protein